MFGAFGDRLSDLPQTAFFDWFSMQPSGEPGAFKPSGAAFHDLVTFEARDGGDGRIDELRLVLVRSFIEDPRNAPFALDITKSFLRDALGPAPLSTAFDGLIAGSVSIRRADAPPPAQPELSASEQAVLEAYFGEREQCSLDLGELTLRAENVERDGTKVLVISLQARHT